MAEPKPKVTLDYLNTTTQPEFERAIGKLFEKNAWVAARTFEKRPFASLDDLYKTMTTVIFQASPTEQLELILSHPELVGREAVSGTLSSQSQNEQAKAGLTNLTPEEIAQFNDYNRAYRAQFGFPFIICARKHHKSTILAAFPVRMQHSRDEEIKIALDEICQILEFRLNDAVESY